jgi:carbonic anhydrase/acetyltransferase-like protein (isoleucine patch superfamily)
MLRINDEAPNFTAETSQGTINFHEWIGNGWAILFSHSKVILLLTFLVLVSASALFSESSTNPARSFSDPTAVLTHVTLSGTHGVYVAPFAILTATKPYRIAIGDDSDVQDNALVSTTSPANTVTGTGVAYGLIELGAKTILAHGATVLGGQTAKGGTTIGVYGECPGEAHEKAGAGCPSFVGFNSIVDGATIQKDVFVGHLVYVDRGAVIPSGYKVPNGAWVKAGEESNSIVPITCAERVFMDEVVHVNVEFAEGYNELAEHRYNVAGINLNPKTDFNHNLQFKPNLAEIPTVDPTFPNRIIGAVTMGNTLQQLSGVMGNQVALRADEGYPFTVSPIMRMDNNFTLHALEYTSVTLGASGAYGPHSLVHGGEVKGDRSITKTGDFFTLGERAVFFRSTMSGANSSVGNYSLIQDSVYTGEGETIGNCQIVVGNKSTPLVWKDKLPPATCGN